MGLVADVPAMELELPAHVDVLGHGLGRPVTDLGEGSAPKAGVDPGDGEDPPDPALRALDHADDGGKLADLDAAEQARAVEHARIAGHRPHPRAVEKMAHHPEKRIAVEQRVGVDAHEVLGRARERPGAQRHGLAVVAREGDHPQARDAPGELGEDASGPVGAAVVDGDDLEIRIEIFVQVLDGVADDQFLVVAWHENGHARQARRERETRLAAFAVQEKHERPDHPPARHDEGIEENEQKHRFHPRQGSLAIAWAFSSPTMSSTEGAAARKSSLS